MRMKIAFSRSALVCAVLLFLAEVLIATVWAHHRWLRSFFGDLLAVVWVYFVFRIFLDGPRYWLAWAAFAVGCLVELGQYVAHANAWHLDNQLLRTVLGSVADWYDVLAYAAGLLVVVGMEAALAWRANWYTDVPASKLGAKRTVRPS